MSLSQILEYNKLISDFMKFDFDSFDIQYTEEFTYLQKFRIGAVKDLKYHTSWDWLIPVVNKIRDGKDFPSRIPNGFSLEIGLTGYTTLRTKDLGKYSFGFYDIVMCEKTEGIETVYKAVIEFIKWYNKEIKNELERRN